MLQQLKTLQKSVLVWFLHFFYFFWGGGGVGGWVTKHVNFFTCNLFANIRLKIGGICWAFSDQSSTPPPTHTLSKRYATCLVITFSAVQPDNTTHVAKGCTQGRIVKTAHFVSIISRPRNKNITVLLPRRFKISSHVI